MLRRVTKGPPTCNLKIAHPVARKPNVGLLGLSSRTPLASPYTNCPNDDGVDQGSFVTAKARQPPPQGPECTPCEVTASAWDRVTLVL